MSHHLEASLKRPRSAAERWRRLLPSLLTAAALLLGVARLGWADSPLTSTSFADVYGNVPIVHEAQTTGLSATVLTALSDPAVPSDVRAAIVNALGWNFDGQTNAHTYLAYVASTHGVAQSALTLDALTAQEALALGYLLAMDDYFHLSAVGGTGEVERADAVAVLDAAAAKAPGDFTVALIRALVHAQRDMDTDWCQVYRDVFAVLDGFPGPRTMKPEAIERIRSYIAEYGPC